MAALPPPPAPLEYIRIFDLPTESSLPEELRGRILFSRANFIRANPTEAGRGAKAAEASSSHTTTSQKDGAQSQAAGAKGRGKGSGAGFNYSKALKAALDGAGSSVNSRGDGKFSDGRDFSVSDAPGGRAKLVHLTPEALAAGNAERTLQQLDELQKAAGRLQGGAAGGAVKGGSGVAPAPPRSQQQQHAAVFAAAAKSLYDINDDDNAGSGGAGSGAGSSGNTTVPSGPSAAAAAAGAAPRPGEGPTALRRPEYSLRELPAEGPTGQGRLEVSVLLPDVASPGEVDVWLAAGGALQLSVPGKYQLQLDLPYPVLDDTSHAKWSKAKRRLTLTLTRAPGR